MRCARFIRSVGDGCSRSRAAQFRTSRCPSCGRGHRRSSAARGMGGWAPYPENQVTPMGVGPTISAGGCYYRQANDDPHPSGVFPNQDASIHGWWLRDSAGCPAQANVLVVLQAYWCSGTAGCLWIGVGSGQGLRNPGSGTGKWVNARNRCADTGYQVGYRGYTDVDLPGISDPAGVQYSSVRNLWCAPS